MRRHAAVSLSLLAATCSAAVLDATLAHVAGTQSALFYGSEIGLAGVWAAVGAAATVIRPDRRVGLLMQSLGLVLMVDAPAGFHLSTRSQWVAADLVVATVATPFQSTLLGHLMLSYPGGRLRSRAERGFFATVYSYAAVVGALAAVHAARLFAKCGWGCAAPGGGIAGGGTSAPVSLGWSLLAGAYLALLIARIRQITRRERQVLAYPLALGVVIVLLFLANVTLTAAVPDAVSAIQALATSLEYLAVLAMPGAFLLGLTRERLSYGSVAEFVRTIDRAPIGQLQAALRKALRDPTLEIAFFRAGGYVDEEGAAVPLPNGRRRAALPIGGDPPIAMVLHDPSLTDEPKLLATASAATRLALDNARLHALVQEQLAEVRASRRRVIETAAEQRRRLERDLHDGAQQRMLAVGVALQLLGHQLDCCCPAATRALQAAQDELLAAIEELRELARGIHPAILTERGLSAAVHSLAARAPLPVAIDDTLLHPLPQPVEAAGYFVVSEALSNVVKHARASAVQIRLALAGDRLRVEVTDDGAGGADPDRGSGLRGIADRAAAFNGACSITDASPTGTRLVVELRCD